MATYTMQLRTYIEKWSQYDEGLTWNERIEIGRKHLFDFYYPFYDEDYKKIFETNFIKHFYTREIGFETEGLFKMRLESWLNINMPYFNKLFESELIEYDPLINTFMETERDRVGNKSKQDDRTINQTSTVDGQSTSDLSQDSTSQNNRTDDNFRRKIESDTPDERLQLTANDGVGVIEYASNIDEDKQNNQSQTTGQANTETTSQDSSHVDSNTDQEDKLTSNTDETENYIEKRIGKIGIDSQAKLIQEYRSALLRVERQIHNEMQELFMLVM